MTFKKRSMPLWDKNPCLVASFALLILILGTPSYHAFLLVPQTPFTPSSDRGLTLTGTQRHSSLLFAPSFTKCTSIDKCRFHSSTSKLFASSTLPDINNLTVPEMRKELESYGISTKSFLEKKEFVEALTKARQEGKKPIEDTTTASDSKKKKSDDNDTALSREKRIAAEIEKCQQMKVAELKKELESLGISTKSFFEKSEFVKTLATARVDGTTKGGSKTRQDTKYDPAFKDVKMEKFKGDPRLLGGAVIDVKHTVV